MARCDEGYRCEVCGIDVDNITVSDLYLRFVLGEIPLELIHQLAERHLECNPALAQYIVAPGFAPVECPGAFDKRLFDVDYRLQEERRVTQGWQRLQAIPRLGLSLAEYPLSITPFSEEIES